MNWLVIGFIVLCASIGFVLIGGFSYILSQGDVKRMNRSKGLLLFALYGIMASFLIMLYDEFTAYGKAPILQDKIVISDTEFVRVEFQRSVKYECAVIDQKTNEPFVFRSSERDEVKTYCDGLEVGSTHHVSFKEVRGSYYLVEDAK